MDLSPLLRQYITPERLSMALRIILTLAIGIPVIILIKKMLAKVVKNRFSPQSEQLIVRLVYYICLMILFVSVLNEFGFKLSALLGAAGVFGIAIGFASQTSVSNIISGIFLISEKPFVVGDVIEVNSIRGQIQSIDLLSLKLKTPDNQFVRVPNETMIKTEVTNITRYPHRRVNITIGVDYKEDLRKVQSVLAGIVAEEPLALSDPEPLIVVDKFSQSSIDFLFAVWGKTEDFFALKNNLMIGIKEAFQANDIVIPYPHVSVLAEPVIYQPKHNEGSVINEKETQDQSRHI